MKSFVAELCLELSRRLEPSCSSRCELIKRGLRYSRVADERVRGQNKKVKHIVAHEAHQAVYADLLTLAGSDASVSADTMYGTEDGGTEHGIESFGSSPNDTKMELAKRLVVKSRSIAQGGVFGNKISIMSSSKSKNKTSELTVSGSSQASNDSRSKNKTSELSVSGASQASNDSSQFYSITE
jgi:hypothetical protein